MQHLTGFADLAARYDAFIIDLWGVIHDGVTPYEGAVDCLVRLRAAGINPVDYKLRAHGTMGGSLPAVLGWDGAGVVEAVNTHLDKAVPFHVVDLQRSGNELACNPAANVLLDATQGNTTSAPPRPTLAFGRGVLRV